MIKFELSIFKCLVTPRCVSIWFVSNYKTDLGYNTFKLWINCFADMLLSILFYFIFLKDYCHWAPYMCATIYPGEVPVDDELLALRQ